MNTMLKTEDPDLLVLALGVAARALGGRLTAQTVEPTGS